jgi:hypothetical protein
MEGRQKLGDRSQSASAGYSSAALVVVPVAVLALAFGVAATYGVWAHPGGLIISGNVPDAIHYSWWLGHTPWTIGRGDNPFTTTDLNWPQGVSAMNNTTLLLPAVLLTPVSLLAGSLVSLNLLNVLAIPACAAAMYWALRQLAVDFAGPSDLTRRTDLTGRTDLAHPAAATAGPSVRFAVSQPAALIGAAAYAISPAIVNSLVGHITIAFAPGLPILLGLGVAGWRDRRVVRSGLRLGVAALIQMFIGEEVLFQAVLAVVLVAVVTAISRPHQVWAAAGRFARCVGSALALFLPIAAYPLYLQFFGALKQHGSPFLPDYFGADVTAFTTPTSSVLLHSQASVVASLKFPGGTEEHLAYLGWPLLITCLLTAVLGWRRLPVRCAAVGLIVAMGLSLGGRLWIKGQWTNRWGPYRLLQALPVTEASLATRFGLLASLFAAGLLAFAVHGILTAEIRTAARTRRPARTNTAAWTRLAARPGWWPVWASPSMRAALAVLVSLMCLIPLLPGRLPVVAAPAVPTYFSTTARSLPAGTVAVVLPYPVAADPVAMRWQSAAHYRFRMPGGYFLGPAENGQAYVGGAADPPTAELLTQVEQTGVAVLVSAQQRAQAAQDLHAWGANQIVLGPSPSTAALRSTVTDLLGRPPHRVVGVDVWDVGG